MSTSHPVNPGLENPPMSVLSEQAFGFHGPVPRKVLDAVAVELPA
jgi:hypothetical protein